MEEKERLTSPEKIGRVAVETASGKGIISPESSALNANEASSREENGAVKGDARIKKRHDLI